MKILYKIGIKGKIGLYGMSVFLLVQLFIFSDYISPFLWGKLRVENVWWTGADASVETGELYLRYITPDSLKSEDTYYSEVYLEELPGIDFKHTMVYDSYIIKGKVIGQKKGGLDRPSPIFQVESFQVLPEFTVWGLRTIFIIELIICGIVTVFICKRHIKREGS